MKTNTPQIHNHYHYVATNKIAARFMLGFVLIIVSCGFFFSGSHLPAHHSKTKILVVPKHDFFNSLYTWFNSFLASYAEILNSLVSFFGWKKSFLWFWYLNVGWGSVIYFGLPILALALLIFVLKREKLVLPILLALDVWHHGLEFFIQHHKPWFSFLLMLLLLFPLGIAAFRKRINDFVDQTKRLLKKEVEKFKNLVIFSIPEN